MFKSIHQSEADIENTAGILCDHYLPEIYRYIHFWVNNGLLAEQLTLKVLKKVIGGYKGSFNPDDVFLIRAFTAARKEIRVQVRTGQCRQVFPGLSLQQQEIMSLKLGGALDNRKIARILGLPESGIEKRVTTSLISLRAARPADSTFAVKR